MKRSGSADLPLHKDRHHFLPKANFDEAVERLQNKSSKHGGRTVMDKAKLPV